MAAQAAIFLIKFEQFILDINIGNYWSIIRCGHISYFNYDEVG